MSQGPSRNTLVFALRIRIAGHLEVHWRASVRGQYYLDPESARNLMAVRLHLEVSKFQ